MYRFRNVLMVSLFSLSFVGCSDDTTTSVDAAVGKDAANVEASVGTDGKVATDAGGMTAKDFAGNWTGTWNNTTFGSKGAAKMTVVVDEAKKSVELTLDLDGNVFGAADPPAEKFTGTYTAAGFTVTSKSTLFGDLSLTFKADGTISGSGKPAGFDDITFKGTGTAKTMTLTYTINQGGKKFAEGTFDLTK